VHATNQPSLDQRQLRRIFIGLMTGLALSALDTNIVGVALPTIVGDLGGLQHIAWVGTSYLLTSTAATPLMGKLSDLYGRLRLFQVAIVAFVAGSVLCGLAQTMIQLVLARGIQGVGGGGLMAMAFTIVGDVVPPRERGRYVGYFTSTFAAASVAGPLLGGFFVDQLDWRWIFFINVPFGAVALVVVSRALDLPFERRQARVDVLGAVLLVSGVTCLILACTWAGEGRYAWGSAPIIAMMAGTAVLVVLFVVWERRASEPIIPLRLFQNRVVMVIVPMMILLGSAMFGANSFLPLFLQAVEGVSATMSGLLTLPLMIGVTAASITTGRLTARTGRYKLWPIIGTALATGGLLILSGMEAGSSRAFTGLGMLLLGLGMGMTFPTSTLAVQNSVEPRDMGVGSSMVTFFRTLGGALGLAIYGAIFNARIEAAALDERLLRSPDKIRDLPDEVRAPVIAGLADAVTFLFKVAVPVMAVCWALAWLLKEVPLRDTSALQRSEPEVSSSSVH
jgi:EmrB/QacA subfamily drug resistance transporter